MTESKTRKLILLSLMVAYSLALYILEGFIYNPLMAFFPGAKLGLSNIITLLCLLNFGFKDTFKVLSVRILLSSIFGGPMSAFLFSIAGGYLSLLGMYIAIRYIKLSNIGTSVIGAVMHNIGQLLVAGFIIQNMNMMAFLPALLITSVVTGVFVGIVTNFTNPYLSRLIKA